MFACLLLLLSPNDAVARLDHPSFAVRYSADRELRSRMTWAMAVRLELCPPMLGAEGRRRLRYAIEDYYSVAYTLDAMPHIDTLSNPACNGCRCPLTQRYLDLANALATPGLFSPTTNCTSYRLATALMLDDLRRLRIPPAYVRGLLAVMDYRTRRWEFSCRMRELLNSSQR